MVVEELASADGLVAEWVLSPDQGSVLIRLLGENRR